MRTSAALAILSLIALPLSAQVGRQPGMVDPNLATEAELTALPGMTPALVKGVVDQRPFMTMTALNTYLSTGLSKEQLTTLYGKMFIHLNLNTATKEEILLIPGVGNRMVHEFEEYRPYRGLSQFRREIGKYVNQPEVARLEHYVTLN